MRRSASAASAESSKADYKSEIARKADWHRRELAKLENALAVIEEIDSATAAPPPVVRAAAERVPEVEVSGSEQEPLPIKAPTLSERVEAAAIGFAGRSFTVPDIEQALEARQNYRVPGRSRARIAMALSELERESKVVRTAKPKGGKPHVFVVRSNGIAAHG